MPFALAPLPFDPGSVAHVLSRETLEFHHGRHHRAYLERLNQIIQGHDFGELTLERLVRVSGAAGMERGELFNMAAQAWNHQFYWDSIGGAPGARPTGTLLQRIRDDFGGIEGLRDSFLTSGARHFGSGWLWLNVDIGGHLTLQCTADADSAILHGRRPLLVCDLWEHAYYIDYRNARAKYLEGFWSIIDWPAVERRFAPAARAFSARSPMAAAREEA